MPLPTDAIRLFLLVVDSPDAELVGRRLELGSEPLVVGRDGACPLPIRDVMVSRRHAELRLEGDAVRVRDLGSANGLFVGETAVAEALLFAGDGCRIGSTRLAIVTEPGAEAAPGLAVGAPPAPEETLETWFAAEGEPVEVSGNRPFLLDDPDLVYWVEAGRVEIFAVTVERGRPTGARLHFLSVEPGESFFGMSLRRFAGASGFLAVGRVGTRLRRLPAARLAARAAAGRDAPAIARLLEGWVTGLTRRLTTELVPGPRADVSLVAGEAAELAANLKARPARGLVWLERRPDASSLLFLGLEELPARRSALFPLAAEAWVEALAADGRPVAIRARSTIEAVGEAAVWLGLESFHETLCRCELLLKGLAAADELNRLRSKAEYSAAAEKTGREALAAVLAPALREAERLRADAGEELLLRTIRRVGGALGLVVAGIEIQAPPEPAEELGYEQRLARIARASGLRTRKVALRGEWWRQDHGPLLAREAETGRPLALLPDGARRYACVDVESAQRQSVDAEVADRLEPFAHVLYRPFPLRRLGLGDVLRFAAFGQGRDLAALVLMGLALGALGALVPFFTGRLFDAAIPEAEGGVVLEVGLALALAAIASLAFKVVQAVSLVRIQSRLELALGAALWDRLLNLPSTFFRRFEAGDLAERAHGVSAMREVLAGASTASVLGLLSAVFYVALMVWYDLKLAGVALALGLLFVAVVSSLSFAQLRLQRQELALRGRITGTLLQLISGVGKIRLAGAENHAFRVWARQFSEQRRRAFASGRLDNAATVLTATFPIVASMTFFGAVVAFQAQTESGAGAPPLSTGEFIAFSGAFGLFVAALQALAEGSLGWLRLVPLYERLAPILQTDPEVDTTKSSPGKLKGAIELSHVHFRYGEDGPWVLRDVTLTIRPGEMVAFVGASGSGKSTLMRLMLGFETPQKGSIYYDGQELRNLDLRELRQQLGVVLQESMVLPADLYRNIVGSTSHTVEEAMEAARQVGLDRDIREMPMGLHTYVSEGGGGLSGGQRQRLLLARAIVARPRIVFLDEATSALDNRTQAVVTESLDRLQATRIVIAHRLSTIVNADRICVLDNGTIQEMGTYAELMAKEGLFAALARRQEV
jgi:NHLM bacteriocin system ABC transporter ATP-binding protein